MATPTRRCGVLGTGRADVTGESARARRRSTGVRALARSAQRAPKRPRRTARLVRRCWLGAPMAKRRDIYGRPKKWHLEMRGFTGPWDMLSDPGDLSGAVESFARAAEIDDALAAPNYLLANILVLSAILGRSRGALRARARARSALLTGVFYPGGFARSPNRLRSCPRRIERGLKNLPGEIELLFQMGRVFFVQGAV